MQSLAATPIDELIEKRDSIKFPHCKPCWDKFHNLGLPGDFDPKMAPPWSHPQCELDKLVVAVIGSREGSTYEDVAMAIRDSRFGVKKVLSGGARGVDSQAEEWAQKNNVSIEVFHPNWKLGKKAGPLRNIAMLDKAEAVVAVWDGESPGTKQAIQYARSKKLPLFVRRIRHEL
jgi:hypothetical protein